MLGLFNFAIRLEPVALFVGAVLTLMVEPRLALAFLIANIDPTFLSDYTHGMIQYVLF